MAYPTDTGTGPEVLSEAAFPSGDAERQRDGRRNDVAWRNAHRFPPFEEYSGDQPPSESTGPAARPPARSATTINPMPRKQRAGGGRVFSAPRVTGPALQDDGDYVVEVEGMDIAVKIIDPHGKEGLRVLTEGGRWA